MLAALLTALIAKLVTGTSDADKLSHTTKYLAFEIGPNPFLYADENGFVNSGLTTNLIVEPRSTNPAMLAWKIALYRSVTWHVAGK